MIVPIGTKIVTQRETRVAGGSALETAGAVGIIVRSPVDSEHRYRVRFVDGNEAQLRRADFAILREVQRGDLDATSRSATADPRGDAAAESAADDEHALLERVIYRCVVGSRAYGLDHDESDTDRRGVYLPPADAHWSLFGVPEQIEHDETQECYWELEKFLTLALKANPNILECLYSPLIELETPLGAELRGMREHFLSRLIYQTYNGYVLSQFRKLEQDLRVRGAVRWKHAMHLIRLLLAGIVALREGHVPVRVEERRDELLAIRRGERSWSEVDAWRLELHRAFDVALADTRLPDRPDYAAANAFLIRARRSAIS